MDLMTGGAEFVRAEQKQRELLMQEVFRSLPTQVTEEELHAHFGALPGRYFLIHSAAEVSDDLMLAHRFLKLQVSNDENPLAPVINWRNEPDRACNVVKVCTWDRAGLFRKIAGSLSAASLNILSAQIFSRSDGVLLDTISVNDARSGSLAGTEQREQFETLLNKALTGEEVDFPTLIARQKIARPMYQAYTGENLPTIIRFDNDVSDNRTLIEVETEDRIGLLYTISQTLAESAIDIAGAKISTEKGAGIDSFYVREIDGSKILAPERQRAIERKLRLAIAELDRKRV
jgi:[protein-PII] uridylyltransferase